MTGTQVEDDADAPSTRPEPPDHPSLLRPSMFAAGWWISVVGGLALVGSRWSRPCRPSADAQPAFWVIAGLLLLFELSPVIVGSGYDSQGVATSDAFIFAILYLYGPWPAIALISLRDAWSPRWSSASRCGRCPSTSGSSR